MLSPSNAFTWQPVDEPAELFLGDVGPAEVQSCRLSPDDTAQHEWCDGLAAVQIDVLPKPFVAAPDETKGRVFTDGRCMMKSA